MSVTPHVPLPEHLELPEEFEDVEDYLALVDPDLRIRKSAEAENLYVLERRWGREGRRRTALRGGVGAGDAQASPSGPLP
jgi:hypothetical protein